MNIGAFLASTEWWAERRTKGAHHWITKNIPFLFDTLDALYLETRKLPLKTQGVKMEIEVTTSYSLSYNLFLTAEEYSTVRLILSLCGDVYNLLTPLVSESLVELTDPIKRLYHHSNSFRDVRNFFTHLDEVITDMDKHGISGPKTTEGGIRYTKSAKNCVHLIWANNTVYFTYKHREWSINLDKHAFQPIFQTATEIYNMLHNTANRKNFPTPQELYPDYA